MYRYITQSPFHEKINYSYSEYIGLQQITIWREFRNSFLQIRTQVNLKDSFNARGEINEMLTFQRFYKIHKNLNSESYFNVIEEINLLLKRFEVTKKIYIDYDKNFRSKTRICDNVLLYELFGVILIKTYILSQKIQYLNALIKLNDILCSYYLYEKEQRSPWFVSLLDHEIEYVDHIIKKKGIR